MQFCPEHTSSIVGCMFVTSLAILAIVLALGAVCGVFMAAKGLRDNWSQ